MVSIALFAGGRGSSSIIEALKNRDDVELTILVNAYDDGLSTGQLRTFVPGMLGPSDVRKNFTHLLDADKPSQAAIKDVLEYRFPVAITNATAVRYLEALAQNIATKSVPELSRLIGNMTLAVADDFQSYLAKFMEYYNYQTAARKEALAFADFSFGNLILAGAYLCCGCDFNKMIATLSSSLALCGKIINITQGEDLKLVALKSDGTYLVNEEQIVGNQSAHTIRDIFLLPSYLDDTQQAELQGKSVDEKCQFLADKELLPLINPDAARVLQNADIIIYGPGTQHSSLFPSYLTVGCSESIAANKSADKIFVANLVKDHEIVGETAATLCHKLFYYLGGRKRDEQDHTRFVTSFFFQKRLVQSEQDIPFNEREFPFPLDRVVLGDWDHNGRHYGEQIVSELVCMVNNRIDRQQMRSARSVTIITPGLNERRTVKNVLHDLALLDLKSLGLAKEIIYVDGGSVDGSYDLAQQVPGIRAVQLGKDDGFGRGAALKKGIELARGHITIFFPSDNEYDPQDILRILKAFMEGEFRAILGTRSVKCINVYSRLREIYSNDWALYFMSKWGGILLSFTSTILFSRYLGDTLTGIKAFDTKLLKSFDLQSNGFDIEVEMLAKASVAQEFIMEIPVNFTPRTRAQGKKTRIKDGILAFYRLFQIKFCSASSGNKLIPLKVRDLKK